MVTPDEFENNLLNEKKARFLAVVKKTANTLKVPVPKVNFDGCEDDSGDEEAHIHPEMLLICVSEKKLKQMSYDDIEHTASHEVTHLADTKDESNPHHSNEFYKRHQETVTSGWKPPAGTVHINGGGSTCKEIDDEEEIPVDKEHCNYHLCGKKAKLRQCKYCENYYCDEHHEPYEPECDRKFKTPTREDGHPCAPYADVMIEKKKKEKDKYGDALAKLLGRKNPKKKPIYIDIPEPVPPPKPPKEPTEDNYRNTYTFLTKLFQPYIASISSLIKEICPNNYRISFYENGVWKSMTTSAFRYKLNTYGEEFQESMGDKIEDNKLQVFLLSFFKMLASLIKSDVLTKHQLFTLTREFLQLTEKRLKISIKTKLISEFEAQIKEIKPPTINPIPGGRTPGISNPNPTKYSGWAGPITFVIMLVGIFLFFTLYPSEVNIPVNVSPVIEEVVEVQKIIPVVEDEPTINTYRDYLDYPKVYHDQEIEMTGTYITREEERENKFYVDSYLQDDEGDTIKLKGTEGRQLEQGKTYNISGTFKNWPTGAGLDVKKVKENEKDI